MSDFQNLAIAQAVYRAVADEVSTKNPDGLRSRLDRQVMADYVDTGVKSRDLIVNGEKVGTYTVKVSKAKPAKESKQLAVRDPTKVAMWARDNADELAEFMEASWPTFADFCFERYGEVPDGCEVVTTTTEAVPPQPTGTTLRVDAEKVGHAMAGQLPQAVAGLLGE